MAKKLTYQSTFDEVCKSLMETLGEIEKQGETKQLKFDMLLKYGRILLMEKKLDRAHEVFLQCSIHGIDNNVSDIKELYYWSSRCLEEEDKKDRAVNGYLRLLERERFTKNDEEFVDAILDRLILNGDISALVNDYKKNREEELNNPKDLLGKVIKFLREKNEVS